MALFDLLVIVIVVLAGIRGFQRGLVIEVFSFLASLIGLFLALKLTFPIALRYFGDSDSFWILALGIFVLLFFLTIWVARIFAISLKKLIDFTPIGLIDNVLGVIISIVKWIFIFSTTIWVAQSLDLYLPAKWVKNSNLYEVVASVAPVVVDFVSSLLPWFEDVMDNMGSQRP